MLEDPLTLREDNETPLSVDCLNVPAQSIVQLTPVASELFGDKIKLPTAVTCTPGDEVADVLTLKLLCALTEKLLIVPLLVFDVRDCATAAEGTSSNNSAQNPEALPSTLFIFG